MPGSRRCAGAGINRLSHRALAADKLFAGPAELALGKARHRPGGAVDQDMRYAGQGAVFGIEQQQPKAVRIPDLASGGAMFIADTAHDCQTCDRSVVTYYQVLLIVPAGRFFSHVGSILTAEPGPAGIQPMHPQLASVGAQANLRGARVPSMRYPDKSAPTASRCEGVTIRLATRKKVGPESIGVDTEHHRRG